MVRRVVGAVVGLAALAGIGVATGYVAGENRDEEPTVFATPVSVPAAKPSFPVNVYDVQPDPATDPLETGVPLQETKFRSGGFKLRAPVPTGWQRVELPGGNQWNFTVATNPTNTYLLRISILAADRRAPRVETIARLAALRSAETDGNFENLIVEDESDTGFTATYIDAGGFQRVSIERFETGPDNELAYFSVALSGREVDREGMADLVDRVVAGAYVP